MKNNSINNKVYHLTTFDIRYTCSKYDNLIILSDDHTSEYEYKLEKVVINRKHLNVKWMGITTKNQPERTIIYSDESFDKVMERAMLEIL